jgi:hypothetical protein
MLRPVEAKAEVASGAGTRLGSRWWNVGRSAETRFMLRALVESA